MNQKNTKLAFYRKCPGWPNLMSILTGLQVEHSLDLPWPNLPQVKKYEKNNIIFFFQMAAIFLQNY